MSDDVENVIDYASPFSTLRRIYLKNRHLARLGDRLAESAVWHGHQEEQPGTLLPGGFPYLEQLQPSGYKTQEDLTGANAAELYEWAGLSASASRTIFAALAAL